MEPMPQVPIFDPDDDDLHRADDYLLRIAEAVGDGVFYVDFVTGKVGLSRHWPIAVGWPPEVSKNGWGALRRLIDPVDRRELLQTLFGAWRARDDRVCQLELRVRRADGSSGWLQVRALAVEHRVGSWRLAGIFSDISEHKALEAHFAERLEVSAALLASQTELAHAAQSARDEAETNVRLRGSFLANMSHELRTPMHGLIGMAELLLDSPLNEEQSSTATTLQRSAEALLIILNDILDFSRLEAEAMVFEHAHLDPGELLHGVGDLLRAHAARKDVALIVDCGPHALPSMMGDNNRMRQILVNLVGNAIKFTAGGEVRLRGRCVPDAAGRDWLEVAVIDTGIGIAADALAGLFDPFTQADASITRRFGGTGLGLAISRRFARCLGGDVEVQSTLGVGSSFTLRLPLGGLENAVVAGAPGLKTGSAKGSATGSTKATTTMLTQIATEPQDPLGEMAILVADDHPINRELIRRMLAGLGQTAFLVEDGAAAFAAVRERRFDLVLMDVQMPVLSGPDATRLIRQWEAEGRRPRTRIVALTASAMPGDREAFLAAGMDAYLAKPFRRAQLEAVLRLGDPMGNAAPAAAPIVVPSAAALPLLDRLRFDDSFGDATSLQRTEVIELTLAGLASFEADHQASKGSLRSQLHRLASAVGIVGCMRLSAQARALERELIERAATEASPSLSAGQLEPLMHTLVDTRLTLKSLLTKVSNYVAVQETARC
jgi:signal transduction histidine kinase/CheY-like chemotaxis protein